MVRCYQLGSNTLTTRMLSGLRASSTLVKGVLTFSSLIQYIPLALTSSLNLGKLFNLLVPVTLYKIGIIMELSQSLF